MLGCLAGAMRQQPMSFQHQPEYQGCDNPILIRIEGRAGHGAGTPKDKLINQIAEVYGYALSVINSN